MKLLNNLKTNIKLLASFMILGAIAMMIAVIGFMNMNTINTNTSLMYSDRLLPVEQIGTINQSLFSIRSAVFMSLLIPAQSEANKRVIEEEIKKIDQTVYTYKEGMLLDAEKSELNTFEPAWAGYKVAIEQILIWEKSGDTKSALESLSDGGREFLARNIVTTSAGKLLSINVQAGEALNVDSNNIFSRTVILLVVTSIAGLIAAIILGLIISNSISHPLETLVTIANSLAKGDLMRDMDQKAKNALLVRSDEVGDIGRAFDGVIEYLQFLGDIAGKIAQRDLTIEITPRSEKDEVGRAYVEMVSGLKSVISQVAESANRLTAASDQLASAAGQAGQATSQITTTVQEVARGITQQAKSVTITANSVEQMGKAISGVANGAQEQAAGITRASSMTTRMNENIVKVAGNAESVTRDSGEAARVARDGSHKVEETIREMNNIKEKVGISAQKVEEMGVRSEQISQIVETIEEIASQTNLLALNAAIEAARAGEHGKSFAVVADEVRKLAERARGATKEIDQLIKEIQVAVRDAVEAMKNGANEVEMGVNLANAAGNALSGIITVAEAVYNQSEMATAGVLQMKSAANDLSSAVETVSAVTRENTTTTEEMTSAANEVTRAIETIASISQQSSASIEEVSASAQQMSAQVAEVTSSAEALAVMADALQKIIAQFRLA